MARNGRPIFTLTLRVATGQSATADRFVTIGATGVQRTGADANAIGVARSDATASEVLAVDVLGSAPVESGAAITLGQTVKSDSQGRAIPWATSGARLGVALESASAAGQFVEVLLLPNAA